MRAADLLGGGLDVEPRRDPLHQPQDQPEVLHVGPHGLGDARVLHLDRDVAAVVQPRAVDLADRGGGDRVLVERVERLGEVLAEVGLDDLAHVVEADLRRRVAQLAELALELLAVLLGHQADVEERHHLAELHRRALHRPQRGDDLLGGLEVAALERRLLALVRARDVRRSACRAGAPPGRPRGCRPSPCAPGARSGCGPWPSTLILAGRRPRPAGRSGRRRRRGAGGGRGRGAWRDALRRRGGRRGGARRRRRRRRVGVGVADSSGVAVSVGVGVAFSSSWRTSWTRCRRRTSYAGRRWRRSRRRSPAPTRSRRPRRRRRR